MNFFAGFFLSRTAVRLHMRYIWNSGNRDFLEYQLNSQLSTLNFQFLTPNSKKTLVFSLWSLVFYYLCKKIEYYGIELWNHRFDQYWKDNNI